MRRPLREILEVGLDFIEFLGETNRKSITEKDRLRDIYNSEFRNRAGGKDPNFSSVLYALRKFHKASVRSGTVLFNPKVRLVYQDQWRTSRRCSQPASSQPVPAGPSAAPSAPSAPSAGAPPPGTETQVQARRRLANQVLQSLRENRSTFIADKFGIEITSDRPASAEEGKIRFDVERGRECTVTLYIANTGTGPVYFCYYSALHWMRCCALSDKERVTRVNPLCLSPGQRYEVQVSFHSQYVGFFPATLAFEFKTSLVSNAFHIVRFLEAMCSSSLAVDLAPVTPYKPQAAIKRVVMACTIVEGEPPESHVVQRLEMVLPLGDYKCPQPVRILPRFLQDGGHFSEELQCMKDLLESPLSFQNYAKRFQLLLHLEEIQMEVDIKKYDMHNAPMVRDAANKRLLALDVPGVAENRPSVLKGDHLLVSMVGDGEPLTKYKGYVHRVELESVKLGFSKKMMDGFIDKMKFNVEFTINRFPLKLQHRAVLLAVQNRLEEVLFPSGCRAENGPPPSLRLFDRKLEKNPEQYGAVQCIVMGASKPAPYLVFGPPGTGKTVTVVEAIKQVHKVNPSARILACAPSNSAADLLCERTLQNGGVDAHHIYRLYASSRDPREVPAALMSCCNWDLAQDCFVFPSKESLMEYKILVTTVVTAGRLVSGGLPTSHFSHIFIDEAGHAVEPECIIGLSGLLCAETGQLVLAGDPQQLGPILRSPLAIQHGLGLSLLERLMKHNRLYKKDEETQEFDRRFVTKLLRNYRSHPAILKIPNELFYEGELQVYADEILRNSYCSWEHLPKKGFPLIFHGVSGKDEREGNSPSFFNISEIDVLVDYLKKLLLESQGKKGIARLSPRDIGIIAPYRKQVQKIQKAIKSVDKELSVLNDINELKVGSVEEFQGQERKVILVSAVRSTANYVKLDHQFSIGFLRNEKRFNVAVTRAKALLIVVGNPLILTKDPTWGRFISY
ncbi:putative helicase mov-10-B.2 isoform X2 [Anguilla anguilla]|nr:putative helicase mov-10-B.2 isoform X2 [Anguilla anguilla]